MIGYYRNSFNCAHWAIEEINMLHGVNIDISNDDTWQASFIPLLRSIFKPLSSIKEGCLVVMSQRSGGLHLGVCSNRHVKHNFSTGQSGCVIISDMGTIRQEYAKVRFYEINKEVSK